MLTDFSKPAPRQYTFSVPEGVDVKQAQYFIKGLLDRMGISFFKYGYVKQAYPERVNALASLDVRVRKYLDGGNTEFLMDAANFAMIEAMLPRHNAAKALPRKDAAPGTEFTVTSVVPSTEFSERYLQQMLDCREESHDRLDAVSFQLKAYEADGDPFHLVAVGSLLMHEFNAPSREGAFFEATDSNQSPGRVGKHGHSVKDRNDSNLWNILG